MSHWGNLSLIIYKMEEYLRRTDYIIFGIWTILIGVLILVGRERGMKDSEGERTGT